MKQTSLAAWAEVKKDLTDRQYAVMLTIRQLGGYGTMHQIAMRMLVPLHSLSGRFGELERMQYITPSGLDVNPGHRPRTIYRLVEWPLEGKPTEISQGEQYQAKRSPPVALSSPFGNGIGKDEVQ